jgi:CheY-like chemotaxis protein
MPEEARGLRFLVVEDHSFQRRILAQVLRQMGAAQVLEAEDGQQALDVLRAAKEPIDIVVSDLWMPGMDGMQLMRRLGEAAPHASVILASALDPEARELVAREAKEGGARLLGASDKPLTAAKLAPLIALHRDGRG